MKTLKFNDIRAIPPARVTAIIKWQEKDIKRTEYRTHGKRHREDGPAEISTNKVMHCDDCEGEHVFKEMSWYRFGRLHREFAPARVESMDGEVTQEEWFLKGVFYDIAFPEEYTKYWGNLYKYYKRRDIEKARFCMTKILGEQQ